MGNKIEIKDLLGSNPMGRKPKTVKELCEICGMTYRTHTFLHYTSAYNAQQILKNESFLFSNMKNMNDKDEESEYGKDAKKVFSLCFVDGKDGTDNEKIPLWYLYSGISGDGVSLGLTSKKMLDWINGIEEVKVLDQDRQETGRILKRDVDFYLDYGWVYYLKKNGTVKLRNGKGSINDSKLKFRYRDNPKNMFVKAYPWEYENEFRIVIRTNEEFERLKVTLPEEIQKAFQITFAPEAHKNESKNQEAANYLKKGWKTKNSGLDISMGLCGRNIGNFTDFISQCADTGYRSKDLDKLIETIKDVYHLKESDDQS